MENRTQRMRVEVVGFDAEQRERWEKAARREGLSLSAWFRRLAELASHQEAKA